MAGLLGGGKSTSTTESRVSTFDVTEASYGLPISLVFGTQRVSGRMLDYDDFVAIAHTTTTTQGGKGGSVTSSNTSWTYTVAAAIALAEGTCQAVGKIWTSDTTTNLAAAGLTFFNGAVAQEPWAYMLTNHPAKALRYSGVSYVAGVIDLGSSSSLPQLNFEVYGLCQSGVGTPSTAVETEYAYNKKITIGGYVSGTAVYEYVYGSGWTLLDSRYYTIEQAKDSYENNIANTYTYTFNFDDREDGYDRPDPSRIKIAYTATSGSVTYTATDANPQDIISEIMTNLVFGVKFPKRFMGDLLEYRNYCTNNGLLLSEEITSQTQASDTISSILEATNSNCFWSQGKFKISPYIDGLTPVFEIDDDNIQDQGDESVSISRDSFPDCYNYMQLEYSDRANDYNTGMVYADAPGHIDQYGVRMSDVKTHKHITTAAVAKKAVHFILNRQLYILNQYTFKLGQEFVLLDPMDPVLLTCKIAEIYDVPVRIISVKESAEDLTLEITAEDNPTGVYTSTLYDIQEAERYKVDYNVDPGNSTAPAIVELPTVLTDGTIKTSIATAGGANWGGANVWVSDDGSTYKQVGSVSAKSRYGTLAASLPDSATTIDTTNTLSVNLSVSGGTLTGGTQADAQNYRTLCWVDGEIIAYATATLTGAHQYSLSYLVRGCYGTPITSHASGTDFVRLDDELFGYSHSLADIGKTVYVKLQSINIYGAGAQDLSDVTAYPHTIQQYFVPQVTDLTCSQAYREIGDGTIGYELTLTWSTPDADVYKSADVFMRSNLATAEELESLTPDIIGGVAVDRLGLDVVPWKQIGSGVNKFTLAGCSLGATYKFMVVAKDPNGVSADSADAPTVEYTVAVKPYTPTMPTGFSLSVSDKVYASWNANTDTDVDFYELRTNADVGNTTGRLYRGTGIQCNPELTSRTGALYLYAHNPSGHYSAPLSYSYSYPAPSAPTITIADMFQGFVVTSSTFPARVLSLNVHIDGAVYKSPNNQYRHSVSSGIFAVSAAFADYFGEGTLSAEQTVVVEPTIDPALIAAESLSLEMMDATVKAAVEKAQNAATQTALDTASNAIDAAEAEIASVKGRLTSAEGTISTHSAAINTLDGAIELKADETTVNTLTGRVTTAEGSITTQAGQIALKANQTDVNTLTGRVGTAETNITANANAITLRATQASVDTLSGTVAGHSSAITQNATNISSVVTELGKPIAQCSYTAIAQALEAINLRAVKANLISQINICPEAITIDGKYTHITGDTVIDNNLIVGRMIAANAISADKIAAGAVSADKIAAGAVTADKLIANSIDSTIIKQSGVALSNLLKECWTPCWTMKMWNGSGTWYDAANYPSFPAVSTPSLGSIMFQWESPDYVMFEMKVKSSAAQTANQYLSRVDDDCYIYINGILAYYYGSGQPNATLTYSLVEGVNTIQVFVGDVLGTNCGLTLMGDIINGTTIKFNG